MTAEQMKAAEDIIEQLSVEYETDEAKEIAAYVAGYFTGRSDEEELRTDEEDE